MPELAEVAGGRSHRGATVVVVGWPKGIQQQVGGTVSPAPSTPQSKSMPMWVTRT